MALTKNQQTVQDLFGTHLGRQAGTAGQDYWAAELDRGQTVEDLVRGIQSGSEWQERNRISNEFAAANDGTRASDAYLDQRVAPGGGLYDQQNIADVRAGTDVVKAPTYAAGNTWADPLNADGEDHWDELGSIYQQLQIGNNAPTLGGSNPNVWRTNPMGNTGNYDVGVTHDETGVPIIPDATTQPINPPVGTTPPVGTDPAGGGWWNDFADADAFKEFMQGGSGSSGGEFDQFLKFMTALQGMGGFGGGSGYGYGGYGGFAPGGVRPNVGMNNTMNALNAFKFLGSGGDGNVQTGLLSGLG